MFDLDAVANEEGGIPFDFTFGGEKYQLPPRPDVLAASLMSVGNLYGGLARLMGDEQWERILGSDAVMDEPKLAALLAAYKAHSGVDLGESVASTSS